MTDANGCTASTTIKSTFSGGETGNGPTTADMQITTCNNENLTYFVNSLMICNGGEYSLPLTSFKLGDVVQFAEGVDCPNGATYCGTITAVGLTETPDAIITLDTTLACNSPQCFE